MKLLFILGFTLLFGWLTNSTKNSIATVAKTQIQNVKDTVRFISHIQPILIKNCSPCHFTGGKMYERMPFDKDTTIINHQAGILKRIKGDENLLLRSFLQQQAKQ